MPVAHHKTPDAIVHGVVDIPGVRIELAHAGDPAAPMVIFLHGFPDLRQVWYQSLTALQDQAFVVAPDGRGVGGSTAPAEAGAYKAEDLATDVVHVIRHFGHKRAILVGHDWGGMIAWWTAILHPEVVSRLIVLNSPHPGALQDALNEDPAQRAASAYIEDLRAAKAEEMNVSASLETHLAQKCFSDEDRTQYRSAFADGKTLDAFLNWYRQAPFRLQQSHWHKERDLRVACPVDLLWGEADPVFLPGLLPRMQAYVPHMVIGKLAGCGHNSHIDARDQLHGLIRQSIEGER